GVIRTEPPVAEQVEVVESSLPGAPPLPADVQAALQERLAASKAPFRTRHLDPGERPVFTNRLLLESSPYLRQHAHNPVNWFPWGDEAFELAAELGRPVFLSIGYATCHWCHVMEDESFEDPSIAELINSHYIPVKVDREERPDIDAIYMTAVRGFTGGHGGWPMTMWLTPDREPYYGATYVPPEDGMRGRPTGLRTMLSRLHDVYVNEPEKVKLTTAQVLDGIRKTLEAPRQPGDVPPETLELLVTQVDEAYDPELGGRARAPKFPSNVPIRALLRSDDPRANQMATHTLEAMANGGIYDHVGGGFHRYSTDAQWLVPHFEKMLYDNATLAVAYTEAAQMTGDASFERIARQTLDALERDFEVDGNGFASATDADSLTPGGEREEGYYFTWTPDDLAAALTQAEAKRFAEVYQVTARGDLDGRGIPHLAATLDAEVDAEMAPLRAKLLLARNERAQPLRDDKVLAGWNGLAISAFARAGRVFGEPRYVATAERTAQAVWERQWVDGQLRRVWTPDGAHHTGLLEDYAFLAAGTLELFEATGDRVWLERTLELDEVIASKFLDTSNGGYFVAPDDAETLLAREKAGADGAIPSGASVHALTLMRLAELTTKDGYRDRAEALVRAQSSRLTRSPTGYGELVLALDWMLDDPLEIVLIGEGEGADALRETLREHYLPSAVFVDVTEAEARGLEDLTSLVKDRGALGGEPTVYVCQQGVCQQPVNQPDVLREQLEAP
ncbi:MAG: thioredoxin domain-containing protein, partial [Proteobacteria bacterium]|nr:thioredoxin domain-containing protein [Pseudomonadota bacterium]